LEKLDLLKSAADRVVLSSEGKVLYDFIKDVNDSRDRLEQAEVAIYSRVLFKNAGEQLVIMLQTISENEKVGREYQIINYFKKVMVEIHGLWNIRTVQKNLTRFIEGKGVSRFFENKFRCMEKWLTAIGLLSKVNSHTMLTAAGAGFLRKIREYRFDLMHHLNELTVISVHGDSTTSDVSRRNKDRLIKRRFIASCSKFAIDHNLIDLQAARSWTITSLIVRNRLFLEDDSFDEQLNRWQKLGVIRSITLGKTGKRDVISI
jgi:hypothetical protein